MAFDYQAVNKMFKSIEGTVSESDVHFLSTKQRIRPIKSESDDDDEWNKDDYYDEDNSKTRSDCTIDEEIEVAEDEEDEEELKHQEIDVVGGEDDEDIDEEIDEELDDDLDDDDDDDKLQPLTFSIDSLIGKTNKTSATAAT